MGQILERAEQCWSGGVEPREFWKATGATEEIAPGVFFVHAFANVTVVRAGGGLVLVDTANYVGRDRTFAAVRAIDPGPVHAAIYTHGHADHAFGLPPFLAEAAAKGWPRPGIVGHRSVAARFDRYRATAGYNGLINARQFSIAASWPTEYDYPDTVYDRTLRFERDGVALELQHARGETDDATWVWWPERRILWTGDLFIWVAPNAGNPQKVQRYAAEWAAALREMAGARRRAAHPRPRHAHRRRRAGPPGAHRYRGVARGAREPDARADERGRHAGGGAALGEAARPPGRAPVPAARLRRAGLRGPQSLAAVRRLVRRRARASQAGARRSSWAGRSWRWPAGSTA